MIQALARVALVALVAVAAAPLAARADHVTSPLTATIFFKEPVPTGARYQRGAPIPMVVIIENKSGDDVVTSAGFSATEFWRKLYFNDDRGAEFTNRTEVHVHPKPSFCFSRQGRLQRLALPVLPVEVLDGPPTPFRAAYEVADAVAAYGLPATGKFTVEARIAFETVIPKNEEELDAALITDCDQLTGALLNVADVAGRHSFTIRSNTLEFSIVDDDVPPTTIVVQDPLLPADPARQGWTQGRPTSQDVKLTFTATDNPGGTGVRAIRIARGGVVENFGATAEILIADEGETKVTYQAEDNAGNPGNLEPLRELAVKLDHTAPMITTLEPASRQFRLNETVSIVFSATDPAPGGRTVSGLAGTQATVRFPDGTERASTTSPLPVTLSQVGLTRVTVTATDVAGNVGTGTASYTVGFDFRGFATPLANDTTCTAPPCRTFKFGNTIPVKFQLFDAKGTPVRTAVATISLTRLSDGVTTSPGLDLGTGAADTGNRFRYDLAAEQYIFNLDTKALGAKGDYRINVTIQGESQPHTVRIGLR